MMHGILNIKFISGCCLCGCHFACDIEQLKKQTGQDGEQDLWTKKGGGGDNISEITAL
jgi:hypothetical protein